MSQTNSSKVLSAILLSYQSESNLEPTSRKIIDRLESEQIPFELIIIDDGSRDQSFAIAMRLAKSDERIRAYQLSRNCTSPYAQFAGLSVSRGSCAVFIPDDLQRPLDVIVAMYRKWEEGHKIVVAYRTKRNDGLLSDFFSNLYYKTMNFFSEVEFPRGGTDGYLADREVIDIINTRVHPINTSTVVEVLRLGFDPYFLGYERPASQAKSRWTLKKKIRLAMDTFFSSSSFPIRLITLLGLVTFFISFLLSLLLIYGKLFGDNSLFGYPVQGWASTMVLMSMFNGLILLSIGVVAEYIWRILEEVKNRPGYIIRKNEETED